MNRRRLAILSTALALPLALGACTPKPLDELTLPGGTATGDDGYTVTAYFANTENLVPNAQVLYNNKQIGTVRSIKFDTAADGHWQAKVRLSLLKSRPLSANVTLKIAQKSLLGAEYLEVDDPAEKTLGDTNTLEQHTDDAISLARTGSYPETEQVLAGVTLLLGNGGLGQIRTITNEIDKIFHSKERQQAARSLITQLNAFFGTLNSQKDQIVDLIASIDRLGKVLADQRDTIAHAIDHLDPGLKLLADQRANLTKALQSVGTLSVTGKKIIHESGDSLVANLTSLKPVLTKLNEAGVALPESLLELGAFPFPARTSANALKGDFGNLFATVNLTVPELLKDFGGVDLTGILGGGAAKSPALDAGDPRTAPLKVKTVAPKASTAPKSAPTSGSASSSPAPTPTPTPTCNLLAKLLGGC